MLRALADDDAHRQAGDDSPPDAGPVIQADELEQESGSNGYQEGTQVDAAVQAAISSVWEAPRFTRTAYTPNKERIVPRAAISMGVRTALIAISGTAM